MPQLLAFTHFHNALITAGAMAASCALLSVVVVLRRWSLIGEGISHAGFGGIGTGWLLSLAFPALASEAGVYGVAIAFCIAAGLAMAAVSRRQRVEGDAAIGIFLVASLGWGMLALKVYQRQRGLDAGGNWEAYLFGDVSLVSQTTMLAGVCTALAVVLTLAAFAKEILAYAFDPLTAQVSGVRVGFVHYLLVMLISLVVVIGMRVVGNILMTALLVLPGATALLVSRKLATVITAAVCVAMIGAIGGLLLARRFPYIPSGSAIVLVLFVEFVVVFGGGKIAGAWRRP